MIVSHKHRFIYLHCRKTAGSSIAVSLSRYLGGMDIQLSGIVDAIDYGVRPPKRMIFEALASPCLRSMGGILTKDKGFWRFVSSSVKKKYEQKLGPVPQHAPATNVAECFKEEWGNYFKFCVVRNPWSQVVSDYIWQFGVECKNVTFKYYVNALYEKRVIKGMGHPDRGNWNKYTIDDKVVVDKVVYYENLDTGLRDVLSEAGLPWDGWLPNAKRIISPGNKKKYRDYYDDEIADKVAYLYRKEVDAHGYVF